MEDHIYMKERWKYYTNNAETENNLVFSTVFRDFIHSSANCNLGISLYEAQAIEIITS